MVADRAVDRVGAGLELDRDLARAARVDVAGRGVEVIEGERVGELSLVRNSEGGLAGRVDAHFCGIEREIRRDELDRLTARRIAVAVVVVTPAAGEQGCEEEAEEREASHASFYVGAVGPDWRWHRMSGAM